jgi:hypothetical protein
MRVAILAWGCAGFIDGNAFQNQKQKNAIQLCAGTEACDVVEAGHRKMLVVLARGRPNLKAAMLLTTKI